jgi:hypothetical protein
MGLAAAAAAAVAADHARRRRLVVAGLLCSSWMLFVVEKRVVVGVLGIVRARSFFDVRQTFQAVLNCQWQCSFNCEVLTSKTNCLQV